MINAQSVRNKDTLLTQEIITHNIDVTLITETWLNDTPQDIAWLHQSNLLQAGYAISTHNRPTRGGGLALLYKDNMKIKKIKIKKILDLIFTETASQIKVSQLNMLDFISDHRLISATISVKKDVPKITRKKIRNYKDVSPATMMENFYPPLLSLNTNEAQTQLTIQLQEMLDKMCAWENNRDH